VTQFNSIRLLNVSLLLSLSFRLGIPEVSVQPHGFFYEWISTCATLKNKVHHEGCATNMCAEYKNTSNKSEDLESAFFSTVREKTGMPVQERSQNTS